jgi:hypothetical protein|tara:strand:+ start:219 stop:947 length:729 start_codon:yes stop_codon:yes gene_type:complete
MDKNIEKLKQDEHYYGDFGKQFLSNSDISILLNNPKMLHKTKVETPALVIGGYFHTAILEPGKLKQYKIIESSTRNTKKYKEMSGGEICLLQHEVDKIELMTEAIMDNNICRELIKPMLGGVVYEEPRTGHLFGNTWKGKADIINHEEKLVIDLKTTSDLDRFKWSASKYNYDSQAYIYSKLFKYEMLFIVIDKETLQIGMFDCSPQFYQAGEDKVKRASDNYDLFFKSDFDHKQYLITKTL